MSLVILLYHAVDDTGSFLSVPPATFRRHMEAVRASGRPVLDCATLARQIAAGGVPRGAVCITFDDGYRSVAEAAWPVLRDLGLPATMFVPSRLMGDRARWLEQHFPAVFGDDDAAALAALDAAVPPGSIRDAALRTRRLAAFRGSARLPIMGWEEVRALRREGLDIGAHTLTHPFLSRLAPAQQEAEIRGSREEIADAIGERVASFAYPYGDRDAATVRAVAQAGFTIAVTSDAGVNDDPARHPQELRRVGVWPHVGGLRMRFMLSRPYAMLRRARDRVAARGGA